MFSRVSARRDPGRVEDVGPQADAGVERLHALGERLLKPSAVPEDNLLEARQAFSETAVEIAAAVNHCRFERTQRHCEGRADLRPAVCDRFGQPFGRIA